MVIKIIFYINIFIFSCINICFADNLSKPRYSGKNYLKNYALSSCIANGYKNNEIVNDSSAAASGYLELGNFPIEAYTETFSLSKKFLAKEYKSITSEKLILMKCIDFYHSKALSQIIRKYAKKLYKKKKEKHIK